MKNNIFNDIKDLFAQSQTWMKLEVEYLKLTAAEKVTVLFSAVALGAICFLIGMVILILLAFSCVDLFKLFMAPALACLSVGGILILLILLVYLLRKPLLLNPISKFITRLFCDAKSEKP